MTTPLDISVVIPTCNRRERVLAPLGYLARLSVHLAAHPEARAVPGLRHDPGLVVLGDHRRYTLFVARHGR